MTMVCFILVGTPDKNKKSRRGYGDGSDFCYGYYLS